MKQFDTTAKRVEAGIPDYAQIPSCALRRLAAIFEEGEIKYSRDNWKKGLPWSSTYNHLQEHLQKYQDGDRSEDHLAKAMWGLVVEMWFEENKPTIPIDDNWVQEAVMHSQDMQAKRPTEPTPTWEDVTRAIRALAKWEEVMRDH
jgi:hypothetical protein